MSEYKEVLQFAAQLGVGGLLAAFIFLVYYRTSQKDKEDGKGREELLVSIVTNNTAAITKNTAVSEAVLAVCNELRRDLSTLQHELPRRHN